MNLVNVLWIGYAGIEKPETQEREAELRAIYREHNCIPVFLDKDLISSYLIFINKVLRQLFHNFKGLTDYEDHIYDTKLWSAYIKVNDLIAMQVLDHIKQDKDMIVVNDFHLMLVPNVLRRLNRAINIAMYFHSPFPSNDVFKILPKRE